MTWNRLPNGRIIRQRPDRLRLRLQDTQIVPLEHAPVSNSRKPQGGSSEVDYSTPDSDPRRLYGRTVTLFGAGSVGGGMLERLASAPLRINLIDDKKVEKKHVQGGRTIYEPGHIGMYKVHAAKLRMQRDHPAATVIPMVYNVREILTSELQALIQESVMLVIAIDDPEQILRISDLAYGHVELIQAGVHRQARSGHVAISMPRVTACLRCTLGVTDSEPIRRLDSEAANSVDIGTVIQHAAGIAMEIIYSKVMGRRITRWDTSKNLLYITNVRDDTFSPDGPGLSWDSGRKRSGCTICNP